MKDGTHSRGMGKYPSGAISQHKALATGVAIQKANTADKGGEVNLKGGMGKGGTISSSGDTGGPKGGRPLKNTRSTPA